MGADAAARAPGGKAALKKLHFGSPRLRTCSEISVAGSPAGGAWRLAGGKTAVACTSRSLSLARPRRDGQQCAFFVKICASPAPKRALSQPTDEFLRSASQASALHRLGEARRQILPPRPIIR